MAPVVDLTAPVYLVKGSDQSLLRDAVVDLVHALVGDGDRTLMVDELDLARYGAPDGDLSLAPLADAAAAAGPGAASQVEEAHRRRWLTEFVRGRSYAENGAIVTQHCPVIVDVVATTCTNPAEEDQATRSSHEVPGNACGQSDLDCEYSPYPKAAEMGLQDGTCSIAGHTAKCLLPRGNIRSSVASS